MSAALDGTPPRRILVVDDSVDTARMMRLLLRRAGFEVATAHDGPAALESAAAFRPEIVLLDLTLAPDMDGRQVAAALRSGDACPDARIIAVTGDADGVPPGCDHLLAKPLDHDALLRLLGA